MGHFFILFLGAVLGAVVTFYVLRWSKEHTIYAPFPAPEPSMPTKGVLQARCSQCQRDMVFSAHDLVPLSPPETALVVSSKPTLVGRKFAEYVCPYCEAAHCFTIDNGEPEWVGVNFYAPQQSSASCAECHKPVEVPPWPKGEYDGRILEAPTLHGDYGLVCPHCHSVCCLGCCEKNSKRRSHDGSLLCPRCFRGPVDVFYAKN